MNTWKANGIRPVLKEYKSCAYIHSDGVVVWEKRSVKIGKDQWTEVDVCHVYPVEIRIHGRSYTDGFGGTNIPFIGRLVVSNTTLLLDGISTIDVLWRTGSDASKEKGITYDGVTINTVNGMHIHTMKFPWLSSDIEIQNDKPMSIEDWKTTYDKTVIRHEEETK